MKKINIQKNSGKKSGNKKKKINIQKNQELLQLQIPKIFRTGKYPELFKFGLIIMLLLLTMFL